MGRIGTRLKKVKKERPYTEEIIQNVLALKFFTPNAIKYCAENLFVYSYGETDLWLVTKSDYAYEFEIKISRSDFKADFSHKKEKHNLLENAYKNGSDEQIPNYFYYAVPDGLIDVSEIPEYAGLIYISLGEDSYDTFNIIKKAPKISSLKMDSEKLNLVNKFYYNYRSWKATAKKNKIMLDENKGKGYESMKKRSEQYYSLKEKVKKLEQIVENYEENSRELLHENRVLRKELNTLQNKKETE